MLPADESSTSLPLTEDLFSALADGELDAAQLDRGCTAWGRGDASARFSWHAYHLIGDVLRCEDLSSSPHRDAAFLQRLRSRLAQEPATWAPHAGLAGPARSMPASNEPAAVPRRRIFGSWVMPAALAAGVAALGTSLLMQPTAMPPAAGLAMSPSAADAAVAAAQPGAAAKLPIPRTFGADDAVVRNARLDRYLRAHRDYGAVQPASLPGGIGRGVETVSFER